MAKRDAPLSEQEKSICNTVIDTYISKYSFEETYESFCVYDNSNPTEENASFEGATKPPLDGGEEHCAEVFDYWGKCLQKIVTILMEGWVGTHLDDTDITAQSDFPG